MTLFNSRPRRGRLRAATAVGVFTIALVATLVGGGTAQAVTPQRVELGTAAPFAVLAASGMTNANTTTINGDVGSTPNPAATGFGACPGANCVNLTGAQHPNDGSSQSAKLALETAFDDAAGRTPIINLVDTQLGGKTLVAGIYTSGTPGIDFFNITGELVLDGENNVDAVWIFHTDSTLITAVGPGASKVSFIRGGQACNVFWKVGSSATIGGGSDFKGTILANVDINVGLAATVSGRLLAGRQGVNGAVALDGDTITKPATCLTTPAAGPSEQAIQAEKEKSAAQRAAAAQASAALAAANAAESARGEAERAAAKVQAAADEAAAAVAAAAKAAEAANVEAARLAAARAVEAAKVAAENAAIAAAAAERAAAAAKVAAAKAVAAKAAAAKAATAKAARAAKLAEARARAAKVAAAKAATAAKVAKAKAALAKKRGDTARGYARPARKRAGFTG